jgi:Uma2 family endonuclease
MAVQALPTSATMEPAPPVTGDELYRMGDLGRTELVKGEIVRMSPTGFTHGRIENRIGRVLGNFVSKQALGEVVSGEVGIYTGRNPDTVRAADVAFISNERMAQIKSKSYLDVAPELVIEVMSPDDAWSDLMEKLDEYFTCGVKLAWVIDPRTQQVYVYHAVTQVERFTMKDTLSGGDVLPGFSVPVAELFASE